MIDNIAPAGIVITQEANIPRTTLKLIALNPFAIPTPNTAPTKVCVVEIGIPVDDATTMVIDAANSAAKPREGVKCVIFLPTVAITLRP